MVTLARNECFPNDNKLQAYNALLFAGVSSGSDVVCLEIEVTGASSQPEINGHYLIDESYEQQCTGRQSWSNILDRAKKSTYIYYLEDGYDGWVIGRSFTSCGNFQLYVEFDSFVKIAGNFHVRR